MPVRTSSSCALVLGTLLLLTSTSAFSQGSPIHQKLFRCDQPSGILCTEQFENPGWKYVGHDEPSLLFYSDETGAGYQNVYRVRLPKDALLPPKQNGHGGTWNFQLRPAFWLGMAMCDDQSAPNPGGSSIGPNIRCIPDSDKNIFDGSDPTKRDYIGEHPGTAFMEMQFYPPGWITSNSLTQWTAALNIDSLSENLNTAGTGAYGGQGNNAACGGDIEYVNFAYIQMDGKPYPPGSPSPLGPLVSTDAETLFMNPGDELLVTLTDTEHGLKVTVQDLTTGQSGFMIASSANGFAEILFDPNGNNCDFSTHNLPYDFHPMYATSSEHTRVPWAAHSYNIAFSDEIGHFEYCNTVSSEGGPCTSDVASDPPGIDDEFCFDPAFAASFGLLPIGGCVDADEDFDGVPYRNNTWPGSFRNPFLDALYHSQPVVFSSPLLLDRHGKAKNFKRIGFENDLPRIEFDTTPACQRFISNPADPNPGQGCTNPPIGADFYPFYSTRLDWDGCRWQIGGPFIPFTLDEFGGSSAAEYGQLLPLLYPAANGQPSFRYNDFRNVLAQNPCPAFEIGP